MNRIIRHFVFETNSSSSHSISIPDTMELLDTLHPDENGEIRLGSGEYGWGYEEYNDAYNKADYAAVYANGNEEHMSMLRGVIRMHTGAKEIVFLGDGYIDHQSSDTCDEAFSSPTRLMNFIFNPKAELIIDNDNH